MLNTMVLEAMSVWDAGDLVTLDVGDFDVVLDKKEAERLSDWLRDWLNQQPK